MTVTIERTERDAEAFRWLEGDWTRLLDVLAVCEDVECTLWEAVDHARAGRIPAHRAAASAAPPEGESDARLTRTA